LPGALEEAAANGDVAALLAAPIEQLHVRVGQYDWTLLHVAAAAGQAGAVAALLRRGLDVNARDAGDNAYALHWAAGAGHLDVVRRLADAGGDVAGAGDDHALEVIGWATCFDACHREVADFLVSRGARHHIFSAIALDLESEVRRIVAVDPGALARRMSRNEDHRQPLHFAVAKARREMVALLIELGADPLAVDGSGFPVAAYATSPDIDRPVLEAIRELIRSELLSAERGHRPPSTRPLDLIAALALGDFELASRLGPGAPGALHLMAKRGATEPTEWLLARGADPNARWDHWGTLLTPLHLAAAHGHTDAARALLTAGADPHIHDTRHDSTPLGWAQHFGQPDLVALLAHI
jgi:ankyrin repeat protein